MEGSLLPQRVRKSGAYGIKMSERGIRWCEGVGKARDNIRACQGMGGYLTKGGTKKGLQGHFAVKGLCSWICIKARQRVQCKKSRTCTIEHLQHTNNVKHHFIDDAEGNTLTEILTLRMSDVQ